MSTNNIYFKGFMKNVINLDYPVIYSCDILSLYNIVFILRIKTDRPGQTMKIQIRCHRLTECDI